MIWVPLFGSLFFCCWLCWNSNWPGWWSYTLWPFIWNVWRMYHHGRRNPGMFLLIIYQGVWLYFELVSLEVNHEQVMSPSIYSHRKIDNGRYVWILTHLTGHRILTKLMKPFTVKTKAIILNRLGNSQLSLYEELST